jgi:hypothetical protein
MAGTVQVGRESVEEFYAGHGTVGAAEAKLTGTISLPVRKHVVVRSSVDNTGETITVGPVGHAADGFVLGPGEQTPPIYVDHTDKVAIIGSNAALAFSWIAT